MANPWRGILVLLLCLLNGCGFTLRGSSAVSETLPSLILSAQPPNSEFSRLLQRSLENAGVQLISTQAADVPRLEVRNEQLASRPITVNPRARAAQYEIRLTVEVAMLIGESVLLENQTLAVERTFYEAIENIVGSQEEIELIASEMRRDLVNQLMLRLAALSTQS